MPEIQLRFVSGGGWDSRVIKYDTRCEWSHVETYSPVFDQTFGAMLDGGVKWRSLKDPQYKKAAAYRIFPINLKNEEYEKYSDFLRAQEGKPYDWRAIVSFGLGNRDWREDDSWFCSELISRALEVAGVFKFPEGIASNRITPRDVWLLVAGIKS